MWVKECLWPMAPAECGTLGSLFLPSSASGLLCSRSGSAASEMCPVQVSSCTPGLPISRVLPAGVSLLPPPCVQRICLELELLPGQLLQELVCSDMRNVPLKISLLCWCLRLRNIPSCFPYRHQLFFCCALFFLTVVCFCWELSSKSISVRWRRSLY